MNDREEIRLLKNKEIDYKKWDSCIKDAGNGTLYAKSWYLDVVSPEWSALVYDDYKFVMPLPIIKKVGFRMVIQPLHCQQLGIFPAPVAKIQQEFAEKFRESFRVIRYQLNAGMLVKSFAHFGNLKKINLLLPLYESYPIIVEGFSKHTVRNLKASINEGVSVVKGLLPEDFFKMKKVSERWKVSEKSYRILNHLMSLTISKGNGTIYAAYSKQNNLCAAAFVIFDQNKIYYLNAFSNDEGRENRAMYSIVNEIIREFCERSWLIDFEGSVIDGVARFYRGFGAVKEDYYFIESTRIPVIGKFIK